MARLSVRNRNKNKKDINGKAKRPNWEYRFEGAKVDGKRQQFSKAGFATQSEAEVAGTKALAEYNNAGKHFEPSELSVSDYFDYWLENYCLVNLADNTTTAYKNIIKNHLKTRIGSYKMRSVDTMLLQETINKIFIEKGFTKAFMKNILKVLKGSFAYACDIAKLIPTNPAQSVKLPKFEPKEDSTNILSKNDIELILARFQASKYQYYAILIAYYTGLGVSEVYGLTWDNIDFDNGTLTVDKICKQKDSDAEAGRKKSGKAMRKWYLGAPKTNSRYRTIKIGDTLLNALADYKKWQADNQKEYGKYYTYQYLKEVKLMNGRTEYLIVSADGMTGTIALPKTDLILVKENGEFHGTDSMKYPSKIAKYELGIDFRFHAIRHTHATVLIENGAPIKDVSERLGHSNIRTTMDTYVTNTDAMKTKTMEIFESVGNINHAKERNERLYDIFIKSRNHCKHSQYYKERSIQFEWNSYDKFEAWAMANGYEDDLSLIRIDKSGNFSSYNCIWYSETKNVKGKYIYDDGTNLKSYSVRQRGQTWQYRISDIVEGKKKEISKGGFMTEEQAMQSAEERIAEMFEKPYLKRVK